MDTIASRLDYAMKAKGAKIPALVKATGMTYQGIKKILDGKTASIQSENLFAIALHLGVNAHWLGTGEGEMLPLSQLRLVPGGGAHLTRMYGPMPDDPNPAEPEEEREYRPPTLTEALAALASRIQLSGPEKQENLINLMALLVRNPSNKLYIAAIEAELKLTPRFETNHAAGLPPTSTTQKPHEPV